MDERTTAAAQGLLEARLAHRDAHLDPAIAPRDLAEAYVVHQAFLDLLSDHGGGPRIGWKVGFTNDAAQAANGATEPVLAGLLGQHAYAGEAEVKSPRDLGLGVEAEVALRLGAPIAGPVSRHEAAAAVDAVAIAIEIVEKRGSVGDLGLPTLVADGTLQYGTVLGEWNTSFDPHTLDEVDVKLQVDGETNGFQSASQVLGHPLNALTWLSEASERHGIELKAGDVILTGAIVPAQHLNPGQMAELASDGLGDIRIWVD